MEAIISTKHEPFGDEVPEPHLTSMPNNPCPIVSVIMANHNGGSFIDDALASCRRQTLKDIEIIVIDDASTDNSVERIEWFVRQDARIILIRMTTQMGPAEARNQGLLTARGTWLAVMDSDDIMHPQRLSQLVAAGILYSADIVADNQLVFDNDRLASARPLLPDRTSPFNGPVSITDYIYSNCLSQKSIPLGYLKPLILSSVIKKGTYLYNTTLQIAEDYDLVARLLLDGATFRVVPQMTYFYRRHSKSTSHRLTRTALVSMLAANDLRDDRYAIGACSSTAVHDALSCRHKSIQKAIAFEDLVSTIKSGRYLEALRHCVRRPHVVRLLMTPLRDRLHRSIMSRKSRSLSTERTKRITLLSRQRVVGVTNGSSVYLLGLCKALRHAGYDVDLISPSPAMFGRWPFLRLDRSMDVFRSIRIRGSFHVGHIVIARDPRIAMRAAVGTISRLLSRLHIPHKLTEKKAPHAIAVPLTNADRIFIANSSQKSTVILADYAFLNEAIPFMLQPTASSAVIMHDLFFKQDQRRTAAPVDRDTEMGLLDLADMVIAIQTDEEQVVRQNLPEKPVILVPMAVSPVTDVQPGKDATLLFVGSNTTPNIDGINWFLTDVWPSVLELHPDAHLHIAGTCCGSLAHVPANVILLGRVDDLEEAYGHAGVVISPLRSGSGLKIKLIEAMGRGKAAVVTGTTLQGVHHLVGHAVMEANTAEEFVRAIGGLLHDPVERARLGGEALVIATTHFSPSACYRDLLTFVRSADEYRSR